MEKANNTRRGLRGGNDGQCRALPSLSKPCGPFLERIPVSQNTLTRRSAAFFSALATFLLAISLTGCSSNKSSSDTASSELGYRYWGYSQSSADGTSWSTAMEGPATTNPADGAVEGWNYTLSAEGIVDPSAPVAQPDFDQLCGATAATEGAKRVGYIIEFGDPAIYPEGDSAPEASSGCVSVPIAASGLDVLNKASEVRAGEGGFICGINGFPSKDCGADPIAVPESLKKK